MTDEHMLHHYGRALDEIYRLRTLMAYEADTTMAHLALRTYPRARRVQAEDQVKRMLACAQGGTWWVYTGIHVSMLSQVRARHGVNLLTRSMFEEPRRPWSPSS